MQISPDARFCLRHFEESVRRLAACCKAVAALFNDPTGRSPWPLPRERFGDSSTILHAYLQDRVCALPLIGLHLVCQPRSYLLLENQPPATSCNFWLDTKMKALKGARSALRVAHHAKPP